MRLSRSQRQILSLIAFVVVAGLWWWSQQGSSDTDNDGGTTTGRDSQTSSSPRSTPRADSSGADNGSGTSSEVDPESGLHWISASDLPAEAQQTLDLIDDGGPYPYDRDGVVFENRERILPQQQQGYYHEYTVPTPGEDDRGARRIVTGDDDEFFWTADHYDSFERIDR
ncbi:MULTISPECIES: ribonuclease domain-containing protein [unclassified Nocardioides]|uniref:ribonuclease domain-containing protein n=1 Tax=unclassified Nocardioides TaxID=2615069 RepID=UPI000AB9F2CD|nr:MULTISPECIES: ribonuclease domain-containing protein [unclassified Nocardioides]